MGEETGVACPVCHCNVLYIEKDLPEIMCPTCEVHGTISVDEGKFSVAWNPDDVREPRFSTPKEIHHLEWIMRHEHVEEPAQIALPDVQETIRRYNEYGTLIGPQKTPRKRVGTGPTP
jgi:hypothetical protein